MADALDRIYGPTALGPSIADLLLRVSGSATVAAATTYTIQHVMLVNEADSSRIVTISIGADADSKRWFRNFEIPGRDVFSKDMKLVLVTGDKLQGMSTVGGGVTFIASGIVTT